MAAPIPAFPPPPLDREDGELRILFGNQVAAFLGASLLGFLVVQTVSFAYGVETGYLAPGAATVSVAINVFVVASAGVFLALSRHLGRWLTYTRLAHFGLGVVLVSALAHTHLAGSMNTLIPVALVAMGLCAQRMLGIRASRVYFGLATAGFVALVAAETIGLLPYAPLIREGARLESVLLDPRYSAATLAIFLVNALWLLAVFERDLEERQSHATARDEAELRQAVAARAGGVGLWDLDITTGRLSVHPELLQILGYEATSFGDSVRDWRPLVPAEDYPRIRDAALEYLQSEDEEFRVEHRMIAQDGTLRWFLSRGIALRDETGRPLRLVGAQTDVTRLKTVQNNLVRYQGRLRKVAAQLSLAEERQRRAIAADLHDHAIQTLALTKLAIGEAGETLGSRAALDGVATLVDQALVELRGSLTDLSPPGLYDLGLAGAIEELAERSRERHGFECSLRTSGSIEGLPDDIVVFLFQAVRELLQNSSKHADARVVRVTLNRTADAMEVGVDDDGRGFDLAHPIPSDPGGFGLFSIEERCELLGGTFELRSEQGHGTSARIRVPLDGAAP